MCPSRLNAYRTGSGEAAALAAPFGWVAPDHPLHAGLRELARAVAHDAPAQSLVRAADEPGACAQIHAEIKAEPQAHGGWSLARCYWSIQLRDDNSPLGLRARTVTWDRAGANPKPEWTDLPADPRLPYAQRWFGGHAAPGRTRVLRYVPLRRLTFSWQDDTGERLIGKFKRRSRHAQAHRLIEHVAHLVERARPGFAVAQARHADPDHGLYFQSALPGADLAQWLAPAAAPGQPAMLRALAPSRAALAQVGRLHARLHQLPVDGEAVAVQAELGPQLATACAQLAWIALMQPHCSGVLRGIRGRLERLPSWDVGNARFCHGDLVCSQFLVRYASGARDLPADPACWAITDFDLCHLGDPCRDAATLLASLAYDLPGLAALDRSEPVRVDAWLADVGRAYLQAYAGAAGTPLDPERLVWQCLCAEVHYLALMLKKDRYDGVAFERRLRRAQTLCDAKDWL